MYKHFAIWNRQEILSNENNTIITWYILAKCNQRFILKVIFCNMECIFSLQLRWEIHLRLWENRAWVIRTRAICVKYFLFQKDFILKCLLGWRTCPRTQLLSLNPTTYVRHLRSKTHIWKLEYKTSNKASYWRLSFSCPIKFSLMIG